MNENEIAITDPNYRAPQSDELSRELKEREVEKLRQAEEKENQMLEESWQRHLKRVERRKKFLAAIKKIFVRNNTKTGQKER